MGESGESGGSKRLTAVCLVVRRARRDHRPSRQAAAESRQRVAGVASQLCWLTVILVEAALSARALLTLLPPFPVSALGPAAAVEIYTSRVLEAVNGTDVRLKCTFSSFAPVGDALTVTWNFRPQDGGSEQFVSR